MSIANLTLRARLLLFFGVLVAGLACTLLVQSWASRVVEREERQVLAAMDQLNMVRRLAQDVDHQFTELGYYILTGEQEDIENFRAAESRIRVVLADWRRHVQDTVAAMEEDAEDAAEVGEEESEIAVAESVDTIYRDLNQSYARILQELGPGPRMTGPLPSPLLELEERFEQSLRPVLEDVVEDEAGEVVAALAEAAGARQRVGRVVSSVVVGVLLVASALLLWILIEFRRGFGHLFAAVEAYGRREYEHRIPSLGGELGALAGSMARMAEDLRDTTVDVAHLNAVFRSITDGLFVLDTRGRIRSVNPRALQLLGYTESELLGKGFRVVLTQGPDGVPVRVRDLVEGLFAHGFIADKELVTRTKAGEELPMAVSAALLRGREEQVTGLVASGRDLRETLRLREQEAKVP